MRHTPRFMMMTLLLMALAAGAQEDEVTTTVPQDTDVTTPAQQAAAQRAVEVIPDFTKGEKNTERFDKNLGPTGLRGYIPANRHLETDNTRQMLVSSVDKGSPADGVIEVGDVIIGVNGRKFESDVRRCYGEAITAAETKAGNGFLKLLIWRKGKTLDKTLKLQVLGSWSPTSPENCEKTQKIVDNACAYIRKHFSQASARKSEDDVDLGGSSVKMAGIDGRLAALGLLATGKPEYLADIKACAMDLCRPERLQNVDINYEKPGLVAWDWGYANLFLSEYYLATGDKEVLPAIERYANALALGQSAVGTWGHRMAHPFLNFGETHGRLKGYGAINQTSLFCLLSLILAQKCGVRNDEINRAVGKSTTFYRYYVDKGTIPYGDHAPAAGAHDDNGKNALAAIVFDLHDEPLPTQFFAKLAAAAYGTKEIGHTGNYFGFLWGALGARRIGIAAEGAYLKELRWLSEIQRTWDGGFPYQRYATNYGNWDCTGAQLLALTAPLKKLCINGRDTKDSNTLPKEQVDAIIRDGRDFTPSGNFTFSKMTDAQLREKFSSWSLVVRQFAATELGKRPSVEVAPLVSLLESGTREQKYGACVALGQAGEKAVTAIPTLMKTFETEDNWLKSLAAEALAKMGDAGQQAIPLLMKVAAKQDPDDPRMMLQRGVATALFKETTVKDVGKTKVIPSLAARNIAQADITNLVAAIAVLMNNPDGCTRSVTSKIFPELPAEAAKALMPTVMREGVINASPSGEMFSHEVRQKSLELLARFHIREGLEIGMNPAATKYWGMEDKGRLTALAFYGAAAREYLPQLRELRQKRIDSITKKKGKPASDKIVKAFDNCIAKIEKDKNPPVKLISLKEFMGNPPQSNSSTNK